MSYDVEVATHDQPAAIEAPDGVTVDGPFEIEPADLAEAAFAAHAHELDIYWLSSRPFFGGHATPPDNLGVDVDWRATRDDTRWREAIVDLFAVVAADTGATSGEAYAERNWFVSANNRLSIDAKWIGRDHRGPAWLTWAGDELTRHDDQHRRRRRSWLKPG